MEIDINVDVSERFEDYLFDWDYLTYLLLGGFGSGKSHETATKIIMKLLSESRNALVIRKTYKSHRKSTFKLIKRLLTEMKLIETNPRVLYSPSKVLVRESPMSFSFPNFSTITFEGVDDIENIKSVDDVTIIWFEEASQLSYRTYKTLRGRARKPGVQSYFFVTSNPTGKENWIYKTFFVKDRNEKKNQGKSIKELTVVDPEEFYKKKTLVKGSTYYHHSTVDDNPFMSKQYIKELDDLAEYDGQLHMSARHGKFGAPDNLVLPQFRIAETNDQVDGTVRMIPELDHYIGFDFGFETSFNAVVRMAVDKKNQILYLYDEIYENHITDDKFLMNKKLHRIISHQKKCINQGLQFNPVVGDSAEPKTITYFRDQGLYIRAARNRGLSVGKTGSRISNTKKIKRFKKIICAPRCHAIITELESLTYARDKNDNLIYDQFNIDPHTFSAIWYGLDTYEVSDLKDYDNNSWT